MQEGIKKVAIINGPNLNLLGRREPEIYGTLTFEDYYKTLCIQFPQVQMSYFQSNIEGEIVDALQKFGFVCTGIILNPGAYTHTSIAIRDAIAAIPAKVIEVHISNIFNREDFRHLSYISPKALGTIGGLGLNGYELALRHLIDFVA